MGDASTAQVLPWRWPMPPDWCEPCHQHAMERIRAYDARDMSRVSDMNVLIRRHHPRLAR
ncbi:hypothetical protein KPP03845_102722 [Streptomyces xanthophaeus]|uniref:hypothetical protein n=1 Tax=Streptomyces xanthophaeus TaxID=67385 RepID=UPI00233E8CC8|nr:hypothetical protein [Streptomyces xanthophaeus]WCD86376.1 hypothetical protein KPP03845_102722 [Streptomyces xanthophaeus]